MPPSSLSFSAGAAFELIYEHEDFIIVNKFNGINVHIQQQQAGLLDYIKQQLQLDVFLCHRLDKATSGLMILAKNRQANQQISQLFANKAVEKYYYAVGVGKAKKKQGLIKGDLLNARNGNYKLAKSQKKPTTTQFFSTHLAKKQRLVILKPHTGKTHQLRVVMQSLGIPILGDVRYGKQPADCMHLHSSYLGFSYQQQQFNFLNIPSYGQFEHIKALDNNWQSPNSFAWPNIKRTSH